MHFSGRMGQQNGEMTDCIVRFVPEETLSLSLSVVILTGSNFVSSTRSKPSGAMGWSIGVERMSVWRRERPGSDSFVRLSFESPLEYYILSRCDDAVARHCGSFRLSRFYLWI